MFLRLTATSADGVDSADRATRVELTEGKSPAEAQDVEAVLEAFAAERLLTLAAGAVEVSHEALLTAWPLLRDTWLADTHADRIVRTRLHATAAEWARHSRDRSYLYTGTLLATAADTAARIGADPARHPPLGQTEQDFLHASGHAYRRTVRRRQGLVALLAALVIGLAAATVLAVRAGQQVAQQRNIALAGLLISESRSVASNDPALSKLLSVAAWRINPSDATRHAMLAAAALPIAILTGPADGVTAVAFSPDDTLLATAGRDGTVRLWNPATDRRVGAPLQTGQTGVTAVAFSPDGTLLATAGGDGTVLLWNPATDRRVGAPLHASARYGAPAVAFSHDGTLLATAGLDGTVLLWNPATDRRVGAPLHVSAGYSAPAVAFSHDGTLLATAGDDGTVLLWNPATDRRVGAPLHASARYRAPAVAFSHDGTLLATAGDDGTVLLWNPATGRRVGAPLQTGSGSAGGVYGVAFSSGGTLLATADGDGTVLLWNPATGRRVGAPLHVSARYGAPAVAFSHDGTLLATAGLDGTVRLWNLATHGQNVAKMTDLVPYLCASAGQPLTRSEWARYVPQGLAYQRVCP